MEKSDPTFQTVKMPAKSPPAGAVKVAEPFIPPKPTDRPVDWPMFSTDQASIGAQLTDHLSNDQTPVALSQLPGPSGLHPTQDTIMDIDSDSDSEPVNRPTCVFDEDGELSDPDHNITTTDTDQALSEEQTYRETVRGIRSFMGWTHIPDMDNLSSSADDNPFQAPKQQPLSRISVKLPSDEWMCQKMDKLNLTLVEGYPSRASEAGCLQKDQLVKMGKSQLKWCGLHPGKYKTTDTVSFWGNESVKLNSCYSRIARSSGLATPAPASRPLSQDMLRIWEKSAREASYICNQAASFSHCLSKVQNSMQVQLKKIQNEQSKGKSSENMGNATDELQHLMNFSCSITQCMVKTIERICYLPIMK